MPAAVGTRGPFVFANPNPNAEPLSEALRDLPEIVAEQHGLDIGCLRFRRRVHYEIRANWKIAIENYLECYHCQMNHPSLVDGSTSAASSCAQRACGRASSHRSTPAHSTGADRSMPGARWVRLRTISGSRT